MHFLRRSFREKLFRKTSGSPFSRNRFRRARKVVGISTVAFSEKIPGVNSWTSSEWTLRVWVNMLALQRASGPSLYVWFLEIIRTTSIQRKKDKSTIAADKVVFPFGVVVELKDDFENIFRAKIILLAALLRRNFKTSHYFSGCFPLAKPAENEDKNFLGSSRRRRTYG